MRDPGWAWKALRRSVYGWLHPSKDEMHAWRWRSLQVWCVVFTAITVYALMSARDAQDKLKAQVDHTAAVQTALSKAQRQLKVAQRQLKLQIAVNRQLAKDGKEAHDSLCVYKGDLEARAAESQRFLDNPPKTIIGIPVTPEVIARVKSDLAGRQRAIDSLKDLDCE